jgi:hypothetical protein
MLLGSLSGLSGLAMLLLPRRMARIYGFPRRMALVRALGARDLWIGRVLLSTDPRWGLAARMVSDLADFGLIALEAHAARKPGWLTKLRLSGALVASCVAGAALLNARTRTRP